MAQLLPACSHSVTLRGTATLKEKNVLWNGDCCSCAVPIAKITGQGLASIAILVALLWGCVLGERAVVGGANRTATEVVRAMRALRTRQPVSTSPRPAVHTLHPA